MFKQAWLNQPLRALALALLLTNTTIFSVNAATTAVQTAPAAEQDVAWWKHGTVYFVLTDRFVNGDKANDAAYGRQKDGAPLRYFMGGDFAGITQKIRDGYFNALGVSALWITPPVEQIHGYTDEGTGKSYGFHGYWARILRPRIRHLAVKTRSVKWWMPRTTKVSAYYWMW
jgi:alpha-amylase